MSWAVHIIRTHLAHSNLLIRLLVLVLVATFPAFAVLTSVQQSLHAERLVQAQQNARQQAALVDQSLSDVLIGSEAFLAAAAKLRPVATLQADCGTALGTLHADVPNYLWVAVVGVGGDVVCKSGDGLVPAAVTLFAGRDMGRFQRFMVGGYASLPDGSNPVLMLGLGRPESGLGQEGAIVAGLSLEWLDRRIQVPMRQPGARMLVADRSGRILVGETPEAVRVGDLLPPRLQSLLTQKSSGTVLQKSDGRLRAVGFIPPADESNGLFVADGVDTQNLSLVLDAMAKRGYLLLAGATALSFLLAALGVQRYVRKPAAILLRAAARWGGGDLAAPAQMPPDCSSEFDGLGRAFNQMAAMLQAQRTELQGMNGVLEARVAERTQALLTSNNRLQVEIAEREMSEENLRQAQKLQAVGQLAAGIAHNFNNLLGAMLGSLELLEKRMAYLEQGQDRLLEIAKSAVSRGSWLTAQLLAFSRKQPLLPSPVVMAAALGAMETLLRSTLGPSIQVVSQLESDVWPALVDPNQLEVAILNLALNAREAMPEGGKLTIMASNMTIPPAMERPDLAAGDYVRVVVMDTGCGMSAEVAARAFEPFFTTKDTGQGAGLGLSQVHGMVTQLGGGVAIDSWPGSGTRVSMLLPRSAAAPQQALTERSSPAGPALRYDQLVLLVDDDDDVREVTAGILEDAGYAVVQAADGPAAVELLEREGDAIALVVADYVMPGMTGRELCAVIHRRRPNLPFLLATGYADHLALTGEGLSTDQIVRKPFRSTEFLGRIQVVLARNATLAAE